MAVQIRRAERKKAWLKIAIDGVSGSGKTYSSIVMATGLHPNPKILMIDTENGSGELYSHLTEYDYINIGKPFTPAKYIEAIEAGVTNGYNVIIIDSLSHCWKYILSYKETLDAANPKASFHNWTKAKQLFDEVKACLLESPAFVIATLRAASEYAEGYDARNNKTFTKVGTKPIAEPDLEYEFSLALRIERSHLATATKDRTLQFDIAAPFTPSYSTGKKLWQWLNEAPGDLKTDYESKISGGAKAAMEEAERIGIGVEGITEADLQEQAAKNIAAKRKIAREAMQNMGLLEDKIGLRKFADRAMQAGLDSTETWFDIYDAEMGAKTWEDFHKELERYIAGVKAQEEADAKEEAEARAREAAEAKGDAEPIKDTEEAPIAPEAPTEGTEEVKEEPSPEKPKATRKRNPVVAEVHVQIVTDKLKADIKAHPDRRAIEERIIYLNKMIPEFCKEVATANPNATMTDLLAVLEEQSKEAEEATK